VGPDKTAVLVALWRAAHVYLDEPPHVIEDEVGARLAAPGPDWLTLPSMGEMSRPWRASVVARARFVEDFVTDALSLGVTQVVLLGAGLDTMALRRPDLMEPIAIFEVDGPATQAWKRRRLAELRLVPPPNLHMTPVDFEAGETWLDAVVQGGLDPHAPTVVASTGVTQYLTEHATRANMALAALLPPASSYVCTFIRPTEALGAEDRRLVEATAAGAVEVGHRWLSYYTPEQFAALAADAGLGQVRHVSAAELAGRYFAGRRDGLRPSDAEHLLVASRTT
jgi:methyltransferase (TIGR00027 family)